ncbi:MAG: PQQ-dependent sugar dehydrogenase [Chthoniobacteraceae bacterium]
MFRTLIPIALCVAPLIAAADQQIPQFRLAPIATGLDEPVGIYDDGSGRLFVIEQKGRAVIIENGRVDPVPFLDIRNEVTHTYDENECGLIGLAFDPDFKTNHRYYVDYDTRKNGKLQTCIAAFTADPSNSNTDRATEKDLMLWDQPFTNHKGGCMIFGPDHMLYIGVGDGGKGGDPFDNGQNLGVYLAKILRIDVDHGDPYTIPADNPFVNTPGAKGEIWCYGMRNPWRFSFDRTTGQLWCGDVGQDLWEEIDIIEKGKDYGWPVREGTHPYDRPYGPAKPNGTLVDPIKDYGHDEGKCIIGGYVYRGSAIPALQGIYVYGDYNLGWIAGLGWDGRKITFDHHLMQTPLNIASFGEDKDGELYLCDRERGEVFELAP